MNAQPTGPPVFVSETSNAGNVDLTWTSDPGAAYQLQSTPSLDPASWADLGIPVTATNLTTSAADSMQAGQRFYRVQLVQPTP
ncbi:MAG TPA: hypothetical protein VGO59_14840 [Verrucomicrobiae bacterium]|jgi:hypothetical protein